jgi:hypothetical protein
MRMSVWDSCPDSYNHFSAKMRSYFREVLIANMLFSKLKFHVGLRCGPQVDWSYRYLIKLIKFQSNKVRFVIAFGHLVHLLFYLKLCPSTGTKFEIPDWDDDFSVKTSNLKKIVNEKRGTFFLFIWTKKRTKDQMKTRKLCWRKKNFEEKKCLICLLL